MFQVRHGGRNGRVHSYDLSPDHFVVRTHDKRGARTCLTTAEHHRAFDRLDLAMHLPNHGIEIFKAPESSQDATHAYRQMVRGHPNVRFVGRVLQTSASQRPVLYTENLYVEFKKEVGPQRLSDIFRAHGLITKRRITYAPNAWFLALPEGTGTTIFDISEALLQLPDVMFCHPEIIEEAEAQGANPHEWHLKVTTIGGVKVDQDANVVAAWSLSKGPGTTIAVIDAGVDTGHEEFVGKIDKSWNFEDDNADVNNPMSSHGTNCSGVACALGAHHSAGVAPKAGLMPIRVPYSLGSQRFADAFAWAADQGADIINCSVCNEQGSWNNPDDPRHDQVHPLPDSLRRAIEHAVTTGRGGKGCVITWAAGNGHQSIDTDHVVSNPQVIAVGSSSDRGKCSLYSNYGEALWCLFPSNDFSPAEPLTRGIWTTHLTGHKIATDDAPAGYRDDFGGTSSSAPGLAGVAALILSTCPDLTWDQVKDSLRKGCLQIDKSEAAYDAGTGHSKTHGYGRIDAEKAVKAAKALLSGEETAAGAG